MCNIAFEEERSWPKVNCEMFGAEPYQFEPNYPLGEDQQFMHGEEEEPVRIRNTDWCLYGKCISMMREDECYFS